MFNWRDLEPSGQTKTRDFEPCGEPIARSSTPRHQSIRFFVDSRSRSERDQFDGSVRLAALARSINDPELPDAETPKSGQFTAQGLAEKRIGHAIGERGAQFAFDLRVQPTNQVCDLPWGSQVVLRPLRHVRTGTDDRGPETQPAYFIGGGLA